MTPIVARIDRHQLESTDDGSASMRIPSRIEDANLNTTATHDLWEHTEENVGKPGIRCRIQAPVVAIVLDLSHIVSSTVFISDLLDLTLRFG